jgi:hypothetical protein
MGGSASGVLDRWRADSRLLVLPLLGSVAMLGLWLGVRWRRDGLPFAMAVLVVACALAGSSFTHPLCSSRLPLCGRVSGDAGGISFTIIIAKTPSTTSNWPRVFARAGAGFSPIPFSSSPE